MTYRDVNDLLVYLRSRPQMRGAAVRYSMAAGAGEGRRLFEARGCGSCHGQGRTAPELARTLRQGEAVSFCIGMAVGVWNHGPVMLEQMRSRHRAWPKITRREMADLSAYLRAGTEAAQP